MGFHKKLKAKIITLMDQDKRVVEYPRSLTDAIYDRFAKEYLSKILPKTMLCLETIEERDALPILAHAPHRLVRVHDGGDGKPRYFTWDDKTETWVEENLVINEDTEVPDPEEPVEPDEGDGDNTTETETGETTDPNPDENDDFIPPIPDDDDSDVPPTDEDDE